MNSNLDLKGLIAGLSSQDMMKSAKAESALYEASQEVISDLVEVLRHSTDEKARRQSAWIIYKIAPRITDPGLHDLAVSALLEALKDEDEGVRRNAPWGLGIIGGSRAVPALQAAAKDRSSDVRDAATYALQRLGAPLS